MPYKSEEGGIVEQSQQLRTEITEKDAVECLADWISAMYVFNHRQTNIVQILNQAFIGCHWGSKVQVPLLRIYWGLDVIIQSYHHQYWQHFQPGWSEFWRKF